MCKWGLRECPITYTVFVERSDKPLWILTCFTRNAGQNMGCQLRPLQSTLCLKDFPMCKSSPLIWNNNYYIFRIKIEKRKHWFLYILLPSNSTLTSEKSFLSTLFSSFSFSLAFLERGIKQSKCWGTHGLPHFIRDLNISILTAYKWRIQEWVISYFFVCTSHPNTGAARPVCCVHRAQPLGRQSTGWLFGYLKAYVCGHRAGAWTATNISAHVQGFIHVVSFPHH